MKSDPLIPSRIFLHNPILPERTRIILDTARAMTTMDNWREKENKI
jgi:hypothetical protein